MPKLPLFGPARFPGGRRRNLRLNYCSALHRSTVMHRSPTRFRTHYATLPDRKSPGSPICEVIPIGNPESEFDRFFQLIARNGEAENSSCGSRQGVARMGQRSPSVARVVVPLEALKRRNVDPEQFRELHARSGKRLSAMRTRPKGCASYSASASLHPHPLQTLSKIIEQRIRENNAHASHIEVRRQLFEAVRIGY